MIIIEQKNIPIDLLEYFAPVEESQKTDIFKVATTPFAEAHFATFPQALIEDMIKAGSSEHGCCANCGMPYVREFTKELVPTNKASFNSKTDIRDKNPDAQDQGSNRKKDGHKPGHINKTETTGWKVSCSCETYIVPCIVFDPFGGSGTTGIVAEKLERDYLLCEISESYIKIQQKRRHKEIGLFQ